MTSRASRLGAALYATESSWGETTTTTGTRILTVGEPALDGLTQEKIRVAITQQRPHEGITDIRGIQGGSFSIRVPLQGHGGTAATTITATDFGTLLSTLGLGTTLLSTDEGTTADGTGTSTTFGINGGNWTAGSLARLGALKDGRGEGQWFPVGSEGGGNITGLFATPAVPNASDVVYGALIAYPSETPGTMEAVTSSRWRLMTANLQLLAHGCYCTAVVLSGLNAGEVPYATLTFGASWWEAVNETFPDATATASKDACVVAAGEFVMGPVGTVTRTTYSVRNVDFGIDFEVIPLMGPGGVDSNQVVIGARRVRAQSRMTVTFDAEASGTRTFDDLWNTAESSVVNRHIMYGYSVVDGRAGCIYMPNARIVGNRPTQQAADGLNRVSMSFEGLTGATTSSDLTMSNFRIGMG